MMNVSYPNNKINIRDIEEVLDNNSEVAIRLPCNNNTGIIVYKKNSHFVGFKEQTVIEVSFYEGNAMYSTEIYNEFQAGRAAFAAEARFSSDDKMKISEYALDMKSVLVEEHE